MDWEKQKQLEDKLRKQLNPFQGLPFDKEKSKAILDGEYFRETQADIELLEWRLKQAGFCVENFMGDEEDDLSDCCDSEILDNGLCSECKEGCM